MENHSLKNNTRFVSMKKVGRDVVDDLSQIFFAKLSER